MIEVKDWADVFQGCYVAPSKIVIIYPVENEDNRNLKFSFEIKCVGGYDFYSKVYDTEEECEKVRMALVDLVK